MRANKFSEKYGEVPIFNYEQFTPNTISVSLHIKDSKSPN
jgi:hypothetical protein